MSAGIRSRWRIQALVYHALRVFLGAVFLYASYDKILHPQAFSQAVYNFQILPDATVNLVALVLPWLELSLGLCLVSGFWVEGAALLSAGLLTIFTGSLVFNRIRGLDFYCGCFSTDSAEGPVGLWTVVRDVAFWSISIYLAVTALFSARQENGPHRG